MSKEPKKGIVYIVQNPAFPHLFKIGRTGMDSIEDRGLNASNVPEDFEVFEVLFGYKCNNPKDVEDHLYKTLVNFRHYTTTGRKTEFFYVGCLLQAKETLKLLEGVTNEEISGEDIPLEENDEAEYDKAKNIENITKKSPPFAFSMVNIERGTPLVFTEDEREVCTVEDDRHIRYKNEIYSLTRLAKKLRHSDDECCGPNFFKVKGDLRDETLTKKRKRMEEEK
jgi:hypothetical protein